MSLREKLYQDTLSIVSMIRGNDHIHTGDLLTTAVIGKRLKLTPNDVVLDIGAGVGQTISYLCERYGCRAICFEKDPNNFLALKKEIHRSGRRIDAFDTDYLDARNVPPVSRVLLLSSLCQSKAKEKVLAKCHSDARPGAIMVVEEYTALKPPKPGELNYYDRNVGIYGMPTAEEYKDLVRAAHWKILDFKDLRANYHKHWKVFLDKYEFTKKELINLYGKKGVMEFEVILMPFIENILHGKLGGVRIVAKR